MPPNVSSEYLSSYNNTQLKWAGATLIAASGLVTAAGEEYTKTGTLPAGALMHVTKMIDEVIRKLKLADIEALEEELPF